MAAASQSETADVPTLDALLKDIEALQSIVAGWDDQQRNTVAALRRAIEALHREAFARLIRALKDEPAAAGRLREVASDEVVYAVLRHLEILKPSLNERLQRALESVRPHLREHGGDVELVAVEPPAVTIRLTGACDGCPASGLTLSAGVEKAIREHCPEITEIKKANGRNAPRAVQMDFVSPFARTEEEGWIDVVGVDEIGEGDIRIVEWDGHSLLFWRQGDEVRCYENACAHLGMPLDGGRLEDGGILTCPYHGFQYVLATGECLTAPEVQLQPHTVQVIAGRVRVKLS